MTTDVMMQLGSFQFTIDTATYNRLTRVTSYRWGAQPRQDNLDSLQYTGLNSDVITLNGEVYPTFRDLASQGEPLLFTDGNGNIHGLWVIESINEDQSYFLTRGNPRKQSFTINMKKFSDGV